jgi:hypothetical protein
MYITRLASNEIFSPSNKIHREVGRAKNLSAPLYIWNLAVSNHPYLRDGLNLYSSCGFAYWKIGHCMVSGFSIYVHRRARTQTHTTSLHRNASASPLSYLVSYVVLDSFRTCLSAFLLPISPKTIKYPVTIVIIYITKAVRNWLGLETLYITD